MSGDDHCQLSLNGGIPASTFGGKQDDKWEISLCSDFARCHREPIYWHVNELLVPKRRLASQSRRFAWKEKEGGVKLKLVLIDLVPFRSAQLLIDQPMLPFTMANMVPWGLKLNSTEKLCFIFLYPSRDRQESNPLPQNSEINSGTLSNEPQSLMVKVQEDSQTTIPNYKW